VSERHQPFHALAALHLGVLFLSANGLFSKAIDQTALDITFHRSWIAWIALLVVVIVVDREIRLHRGKDYGVAVIMGLLLAGHWVTYFHAMQVSTVAVGMIALYTYPVVTALLEPVFAKTRLDWMDLVSAIIVLLGIYLILPAIDWQSNMFQGVVWGVVSAFMFALRNLLQRYQFGQYSAQKSLGYQVLIVWIVLLPFFNESMPNPVPVPEDQWLGDGWLLILLGIFFTALPHGLFAHALRFIKAKSVSLIACLQPCYGVLLAFWVLQEQPNWQTLAGGALIVTAAAIETLHVHKNRQA